MPLDPKGKGFDPVNTVERKVGLPPFDDPSYPPHWCQSSVRLPDWKRAENIDGEDYQDEKTKTRSFAAIFHFVNPFDRCWSPVRRAG